MRAPTTLLPALVIASLLATRAAAQVYAPPGEGPTTVAVDFFLLSLNAVDEKDERRRMNLAAAVLLPLAYVAVIEGVILR